MSLPLLYANNADVKYPLSDFHETDVPNDLLLDLSLSLPAGYTPVVGAIRMTRYLAFVSIENAVTRVPLAVAAIPTPKMAVVYPLTMSVAGSGWIVFGPGIARDYYSGPVAIELDPATWVALRQNAPVYTLEVNGTPYTLRDYLKLLLANNVLSVSISGNQIYLDRNDAELSAGQLADFTDNGLDADMDQKVLKTLGGIGPDVNGNIDIDISGCYPPCLDVWSLDLPPGDTGDGEFGELPLDKLAERAYGGENWPCPSSESGQFSSYSTEPCMRIIRVDILDNDGHAVGTLYTKTDF